MTQTADTVDKALATEGWQKYVAPNTSLLASDSQRSLSLKKGPFALGVFITVAPAQGNATSVQYNAVTLKNDVPFPKDASNIEFDPNKPLLTLLSAEPIDKTLEFYRQELAPLGWSLWSQKLNGVQPAGGASGELTKSGAYAYYLQGDRRLAVLVLETAEAGRTKVKFEELPSGYLETLQKQFFNSDNIGAALVDVGRLPRLDGAKEDTTRSSKEFGGLFRYRLTCEYGRGHPAIARARRLEGIRGSARCARHLACVQKGTARVVGVFHNPGGQERPDQ